MCFKFFALFFISFIFDLLVFSALDSGRDNATARKEHSNQNKQHIEQISVGIGAHLNKAAMPGSAW